LPKIANRRPEKIGLGEAALIRMNENWSPSRNQALALTGNWRYQLSVHAGAVVLCVGVASLI
jgi:hypothetical protein